MRIAARFLVLLLLAGAMGCGGRQAKGPAAQDSRTTVRVENRKFLDINVYVYNGAQRVRLGSVPGVSTRVFTIPSNLIFGMGSLRFQADPIGSGSTPVSQEIIVSPGDQVILVVPS